MAFRSRQKARARRFPTMLLTCLGLALFTGTAASTAAAATPVPASAVSSASARTPDVAETSVCTSGYVCIYKGDIWDGGTNHPMVYRFYYYGTYNVYNLIGSYTVQNCQTGGAGVEGFTGTNGTGRVAWNLDINNCSTGLWTDLTSTYSVKVYA